jgi:hypothetical protein
MYGYDQMVMVAHITRCWGQRDDEGTISPWIVGVNVEIKENEK